VNINPLTRCARITLLLALMLVLPATVFAYVGPGAGLSIIGSVLAFAAAIIVGIFGFLWFPIRRILRKRKHAAKQKADEAAVTSDTPMDDNDGSQIKQDESEP
jgi:predicted permease